MAFYHYTQNNSGGGFDYDPASGISHHVIIEADSVSEANARAESVGLYFGGQGDCPCCGDRWYEFWGRGSAEPSVYETPVVVGEVWAEGNSPFGIKWIDGFEGFIHYADGEFFGFWAKG